MESFETAPFWQNAFMRRTAAAPVFTDPQDVADAALGYFDYASTTPLYEAKVFSNKDGVEQVQVPKMRAMSLRGLCTYLGITTSTWKRYALQEAYADVCDMVEQVIFTQKFEGAAAGLLKEGIISRELGLADKQEVTGAGGGPQHVITSEMSAAEAAEAYERTLRG